MAQAHHRGTWLPYRPNRDQWASSDLPSTSFTDFPPRHFPFVFTYLYPLASSCSFGCLFVRLFAFVDQVTVVDCFLIGYTSRPFSTIIHLFMYLWIYDLPGWFCCELRVLPLPKKFTAHGCRERKNARWNLRQETQNLSVTQRLVRPGLLQG